jgi:lipopolysaccharide transport system permease protein
MMFGQDTTPRTASQEIEFGPARGFAGVDLAELWQHRELLYFLIWRDIKVRYKQTILGAGWAIIRPFFTMVALGRC